MRTGELARLANVNVETLRFYEREGLLPKPPTRGSYREYPPEAVGLVQFIQRAQGLGFSLREIKELLVLRKVPRATCADVVLLARHKAGEIDAKIRDLRAMRDALTKLLEECKGSVPVVQCPIIEALAGEKKPKGNPRLPTSKGEKKNDGNRRIP